MKSVKKQRIVEFVLERGITPSQQKEFLKEAENFVCSELKISAKTLNSKLQVFCKNVESYWKSASKY